MHVLAQQETYRQTHSHHGQNRAVAQYARAQHTARDFAFWIVFFQRAFGGVADEAARIAHFVHDVVAGIDAGGAADAFVLQAVADVDAHRAHLHAHGAVDAVAQIGVFALHVFLACPARLAACRVVGNNQRVAVEHGALEAGIGAHVFAHLLAQDVGKQPGGAAVERGGNQRRAGNGRPVEREDVRYQRADGAEPAGEGDARPGANQENQQVFGGLDADFGEVPRRFIELEPLVAVAFHQVVDPQHDFGIDRLRAGIAAPQAPGDGGPPKQAEGREQQQAGEVD